MYAVSADLTSWRTLDGELVPPQPGYDPANWRDPIVLRDEQNRRRVMISGARGDEDALGTSGCTVWFTSTES